LSDRGPPDLSEFNLTDPGVSVLYRPFREVTPPRTGRDAPPRRPASPGGVPAPAPPLREEATDVGAGRRRPGFYSTQVLVKPPRVMERPRRRLIARDEPPVGLILLGQDTT
jgi:hypothetical protein